MKSWYATTATGSEYALHERSDGSKWLTVETPPSSEASQDLRGMMLPIHLVLPWPPLQGSEMLFFVGMEDRLKVRRTTTVVKVTGPLPGGDA